VSIAASNNLRAFIRDLRNYFFGFGLGLRGALGFACGRIIGAMPLSGPKGQESGDDFRD